jgi:hypothetical protein
MAPVLLFEKAPTLNQFMDSHVLKIGLANHLRSHAQNHRSSSHLGLEACIGSEMAAARFGALFVLPLRASIF